uniref:Uncharacterized protein n=1 Tax=Knipowitschia caucasica TaxID=637954 RepID=A0AAV2K3U3_KNICA
MKAVSQEASQQADISSSRCLPFTLCSLPSVQHRCCFYQAKCQCTHLSAGLAALATRPGHTRLSPASWPGEPRGGGGNQSDPGSGPLLQLAAHPGEEHLSQETICFLARSEQPWTHLLSPENKPFAVGLRDATAVVLLSVCIKSSGAAAGMEPRKAIS